MTSFLDLAPFVPREDALLEHGLLDLASELNREAAKLTGKLASETAETIRKHMAVINSYYSNLIEGNRTLPHEIREAQRGDFSHDPVARDYQLESVAHISAQNWIQEQNPELARVCSPEFLLALHERFYRDLPDSLRRMKTETGEEFLVEPGEFRKQPVAVGRHIPPAAEHIEQLVSQALEHYSSRLYAGDKRFIALAMTGTSESRTARRLIKQLKDEGLLSETSSRSPLKWEIPEHAEPYYFPQLAPGI